MHLVYIPKIIEFQALPAESYFRALYNQHAKTFILSLDRGCY
jgi:hypothetical protein